MDVTTQSQWGRDKMAEIRACKSMIKISLGTTRFVIDYMQSGLAGGFSFQHESALVSAHAPHQ